MAGRLFTASYSDLEVVRLVISDLEVTGLGLVTCGVVPVDKGFGSRLLDCEYQSWCPSVCVHLTLCLHISVGAHVLG